MHDTNFGLLSLYKKNLLTKTVIYLFGYLLLWIPLITLAGVKQNGKIWIGFDKSGHLSAQSDWLYTLSSQIRSISTSEILQTIFLEGSVGHPFLSDLDLWFGYRWSGNYPGNGFYSESRPYQQINFRFYQNKSLQLSGRLRLEERIRNNQHQVSLRLRQRIAIEIQRCFGGKINPYLYDEVFFRLNKTDFTSSHFLSENRVFIGFKLYHSKQSTFQVGYTNQYAYRTSPESQNTMSHILDFGYNF